VSLPRLVASVARKRAQPVRSDAELLTEIARGNLPELGELYDRHHRDVWRVLRRTMVGDGDVDDLVQATFLALPKIAASFDGRESCRGWLCGIAVRLAARQRRGFGRWVRMLTSFRETARETQVPDPQSLASGREQLRALERALARLGAKKRDAFVLVELEGLSTEEAARALEVPAATIRTRLFHARAELARALKREGAL
jgi:RNA polymerase sigma-70 factor, ECF subfamily